MDESTERSVRTEHAPVEAEQRTKGRVFKPEESETLDAPPEAIDGFADVIDNEKFTPVLLRAKPLKWGRNIAWLIIGYVMISLLYHTYDLSKSIWALHWSLGLAFLTLVTALLAASFISIRTWLNDNEKLSLVHQFQREARCFREQRSHGKIKQYLAQLTKFYADKPQEKAFGVMLADLPDYSDDKEVLEHIERSFLKPLDVNAFACVSQYSAQTGAAVALSPWASVDMLLTLWRNVAMVEEIAKVYGVRPTLPNRLKILLSVCKNMAFSGSSQMGMDYLASSSSNHLIPQISTAVAQGVGSALISVRIGISTVNECRPIPFSEQNIPKMKEFVGPVCSQLLAQWKLIEKMKDKKTA